MSEDKISVQDTYDFSKSIENISLSTTYIYGLEQVMIYFMEKMENPQNIKPYFKKFESYIQGELDVESNPWTEEESQLYTIFSLQQLLKAKAYEQGLNVKVNATVDNALVQDLMQALNDGKYDKVGEINKKMQDQINEQLS